MDLANAFRVWAKRRTGVDGVKTSHVTNILEIGESSLYEMTTVIVIRKSWFHYDSVNMQVRCT